MAPGTHVHVYLLSGFQLGADEIAQIDGDIMPDVPHGFLGIIVEQALVGPKASQPHLGAPPDLKKKKVLIPLQHIRIVIAAA